jgi:hypothetical protein
LKALKILEAGKGKSFSWKLILPMFTGPDRVIGTGIRELKKLAQDHGEG